MRLKVVNPKFLSKVFLIFCIGGFSLQSGQVATEYFAFRTSTRVEVMTGYNVFNPTLSLCIRFTDILDRKRAYEFGVCRRESPSCERSDFSRLTLKQIYEFTPPVRDVISSCLHRNPEKPYIVKRSQSQECQTLVFNVTKFSMQRFICYS